MNPFSASFGHGAGVIKMIIRGWPHHCGPGLLKLIVWKVKPEGQNSHLIKNTKPTVLRSV